MSFVYVAVRDRAKIGACIAALKNLISNSYSPYSFEHCIVIKVCHIVWWNFCSTRHDELSIPSFGALPSHNGKGEDSGPWADRSAAVMAGVLYTVVKIFRGGWGGGGSVVKGIISEFPDDDPRI